MKKILVLLFLGMITCIGLRAQMEVPNQLRVDVVYLSSDYLEGRAPGERGEQLAAEYLAKRFEEMGLEPKGTEGYYQPFTFKENVKKENGEGTEMVEGNGLNVIGFINNKAKTTVVIGAHYDHLGYGHFGSRYVGEPAIHNGADDNASGVAALLYLAEQLKESKLKKNNYLFIGFSAEEKGLFGSKYFVEHPTVALEKINCMLNMDMIGRLNEEKTLIVNAAGTSPAWKPLLEKIGVDGIKVKTTDSGIGPSDHTSFYKKDIPVLHFFTGQHQDYHKPIDDALLINFEGLHSVSKFVYGVVEGLNKEGKLEFTETKEEKPAGKPRYKVTLGVMPDYTYSGNGMRIDAVIGGRPAAKAGLEDGDIVVQIGDTKVTDIYKYMEALGNYEVGMKAKVVVKRGEERVTKEVTF